MQEVELQGPDKAKVPTEPNHIRVQFLTSFQCPLLMSKWPRSKWDSFYKIVLDLFSPLVTDSLKTSCGSKLKFLWLPNVTPCFKATGRIQTPSTRYSSALLHTMFWSSNTGALAHLRNVRRPKRGCNKADESSPGTGHESCRLLWLMLRVLIHTVAFPVFSKIRLKNVLNPVRMSQRHQ